MKERWHKWRRRRPHALALTAMLLGLLALGLTLAGISLAIVRERYREGETALREGGERLQNREYSEAVRTLTRGWALTEGIPGGNDLRSDLHHQLHLAQRASWRRTFTFWPIRPVIWCKGILFLA